MAKAVLISIRPEWVARMYGMKSSFVPNNKADLRFRCKQHLRSKEIIESEKRLLDKGYRSVRRYKEAQDG